MKSRITVLSFVFLFTAALVFAEAPPRTETKDIPYYPETVLAKADDYQKSQCRLKISAPKDAKNLPVFVWFHGGGLERGSLEYPAEETPSLMMDKKIVLVGIGYRLSPKVPFPVFIEDAAAAVAWTFKNIERYGGDPKKIFVGGHSAGGYLTGMVGLDPRWLASYDIDNKKIAGLVIHSGQVTTHFHIRKLLKYPQEEYHPISGTIRTWGPGSFGTRNSMPNSGNAVLTENFSRNRPNRQNMSSRLSRSWMSP